MASWFSRRFLKNEDDTSLKIDGNANLLKIYLFIYLLKAMYRIIP